MGAPIPPPPPPPNQISDQQSHVSQITQGSTMMGGGAMIKRLAVVDITKVGEVWVLSPQARGWLKY